MASSTALSTTSDTSWWRPVVVVEPIYMLGRRRTCSRPSRTWICSAVYATSAPRGLGLRGPGGSGFRASFTGFPALPARSSCRGQLGRVSGVQFYRISNSKTGPGRLLTGLGRGRFPAQDRILALALEIGVDLARRGHLVEPPDGKAVGGLVEAFRGLLRFLDDLFDRVGEGVQGGLALGLRGLDHDRLRDHEREVDRRRVEVPLEQAFGDVQRLDALRVQVLRAGHELVHARALMWHVEQPLDPLPEIVGREYGVQ